LFLTFSNIIHGGRRYLHGILLGPLCCESRRIDDGSNPIILQDLQTTNGLCVAQTYNRDKFDELEKKQ